MIPPERRALEWRIYLSSLDWKLRKRGEKAMLAKWLGVSRQTVNGWLHGKTMPGWAVVSIDNYLHVTRPTLADVETRFEIAAPVPALQA